jgi:hypothetical protein
MTLIKGARPVKLSKVFDHYQTHKFKPIELCDYTELWRAWLTSDRSKTIAGLDQFKHADYTCGTSQAFDHFVIKHAQREIAVLRGDFQYHACVARPNQFAYIDHTVHAGQALIISLPFSDFGFEHPQFKSILNQCNQLAVPVCLDLAYWGIAKNTHIDLDQYPCITEITSSLSKSFYTLENHRVGVRFTREYQNDGISMINEVKMQNTFSMSLGMHFMEKYSADWAWQELCQQYETICLQNNLRTTDTVIFALGDQERHSNFSRGIENNFRVCISELFQNT